MRITVVIESKLGSASAQAEYGEEWVRVAR